MCIQDAVEFFVIAQRMDQAFDVAQNHGEMDAYASFIQETSPPEEYKKIAEFYESRREFEKAGDMYRESELYKDAIKAFLKVDNCSHNQRANLYCLHLAKTFIQFICIETIQNLLTTQWNLKHLEYVQDSDKIIHKIGVATSPPQREAEQTNTRSGGVCTTSAPPHW